jgi:nucleotide-binding universal stress UspA family protein
MFRRILIPIDLTENHEAVLRIAADLAQQGGGEAVLLHVIEAIPGLSQDELKDFYGRLENSAGRHLEHLGRYLEGRKLTCRRVTLIGQRVPEIARYAAEQKCDLILVRAPRIDPDNPAAGSASLSWRIALVAPCPVLLVK